MPVVAVVLVAAQTLVATSASAGLSYIDKLYTAGNWALHGPLGVTADGNGYIYVVDSSYHRIVKFDPDGNPIKVFGKGDSSTQGQNGHLYYPSQAAWSPVDHNIYVADAAGQDIQVFTTGGAFVRKWGSAGSEDGQVSLPTGIAVDCAGNVYVANAQPPNDVEEFTSTGTFVRRFGQGHVDVSTGVIATTYSNSSCTAPDVIVADEYYGRLVRFDNAGNYLGDIGTPGPGHLQFNHPDQLGVRVDGSGTHVWVAESGNYRVQEVTTHNEGSTWAYSNQIKKGAQPLSSTHGVAVDPKGRILVANTGTSEVYVYKNLAPALTFREVHNTRTHIKNHQTLDFGLTYNQLGQTCRVVVSAKVTVPPNALHVFTVDGAIRVSNDLVVVEVPLSDRQLGWLKQAWSDDRTVTVAAKAAGCTNNEVQVSKTTGFSV